MAIEFVSKKEKKRNRLINVVFYSALVIFLVFGISYLFLFYTEGETRKEISSIRQSLQRSPAETALEDKVLGYQKKIVYFSSILDKHKSVINLFNFLERNTHPRVWFSDLQLNVEKNTLQLLGHTGSFEALAQQINILKKQDLVKNLKIKQVSISKEGEIDFSFFFTFDDQILKQ